MKSEIRDRLIGLLTAGEADTVDELSCEYELDAAEVFRLAVRTGATAYIVGHLYDVPMNEDGSPYANETDDPDILEILRGAYAMQEPAEYRDARLYLDSVSDILEIDEDLVEEGRERILGLTGMTFEAFVEKLQTQENADEHMPAPLNDYTYAQVQAMIELADYFDYPDEVKMPQADNRDIPNLYEALGFELIREAHADGSSVCYIL